MSKHNCFPDESLAFTRDVPHSHTYKACIRKTDDCSCKSKGYDNHTRMMDNDHNNHVYFLHLLMLLRLEPPPQIRLFCLCSHGDIRMTDKRSCKMMVGDNHIHMMDSDHNSHVYSLLLLNLLLLGLPLEMCLFSICVRGNKKDDNGVVDNNAGDGWRQCLNQQLFVSELIPQLIQQQHRERSEESKNEKL